MADDWSWSSIYNTLLNGAVTNPATAPIAIAAKLAAQANAQPAAQPRPVSRPQVKQPTTSQELLSYLTNPVKGFSAMLNPVGALGTVINNKLGRDESAATTNLPTNATNLDRVKAKLGADWQTIGQIPAGALAMTVANSARPRKTLADVVASKSSPGGETGVNIVGYRPAILDVVPGFIGSMGDLGAMAGLPTAPSAGSYLRNSVERMDAANNNTNKFLGIKAPRDAIEGGFNAFGSVLIPGGEIKATTTLGKVAKGVAELALPLRQSSTLGEATALAVPAGAALGTLADQPKVAPTQEDMQAQQADDNKAVDFAIAGATLGGALLAHKALKLGAQASVTAPFQALADDAIGLKVNKSKISTVDKAATEVFDSMRPIRSLANQSLTPDAAKAVGFKTDKITNTAIGAQFKAFINTGTLPFARKTYTSPRALLEQSANLAPDEKKLVDTALLYASSLDDYKVSGGVNASFSSVAPKDKQALVDSVRNNPKLAPVFDATQQQYKQLLDYSKDTGTRTAGDAAKFASANPNYVRMAKDVQDDVDDSVDGMSRFDAQKLARDITERKIEEERAGIQASARSPIDLLPEEWSKAIRFGRVNDYRKDVLNQFADSGAVNADGSVPLVRRLPKGEAPKSWDKVHTVFEDGNPVHYQVNDPSVDRALKLHSRATMKFFEGWRQLRQSMTTGVLGSLTNGFQFTTAPLYSSQVGALLRAPGMRQGLISEIANKNLGVLDLTQPLTPWTGAIRNAWDSMTLHWANGLTDSLMRDNEPLKNLLTGDVTGLVANALGDNKATALRDRLQGMYEASHKNFADRIGATSDVMRGSPDSLNPMAGLEDAAPKWSMSQGINRFNSAMANGKYGQAALAATNVAWLRARTSSFGRMLALTQDSMRNGFAYSNIAANRGNLTDLDELASMVRRAEIDTSRHGASSAVGKATSALEYLNVSLQTPYALAHRIKEAPLSALGNATTALGGLLALHYASMADPDVRARNEAKTPEQKTAAMSLPGGMEMKLEQSLRPAYGALTTIFDYMSGAHDGNYNPDFFNTINNYFEPDQYETFDTEAMNDDMARSLFASLQANTIAPENSAAASGLIALYGGDPSATGMRGQFAPVKTQTLSGFDPDKTFRGGLTSAYMENMVQTVLGGTAQHLVRTADEVYRMSGNYKGPMDALNVALDKIKDTQYTGSTINRPLFGQYEGLKSVADSNFSLMQERADGIKAATSVFNKDVRLDNFKADDPELQDYIDQSQSIKGEFAGTPVEAIGVMTKGLNRQLRPLDQQLSDLDKETQKVNANTSIPLEKRNEGINIIRDKRRAIYYQKLIATRLVEDQISEQLGTHFTYKDFNPSDYAKAEQPQ